MNLKIKVLWVVFFLTVLASAFNFLKPYLLVFPIVLFILHTIWTLSLFRGILFILIACITGFVFEFFGLKYGIVFGGNYTYSLDGLKILTVPLSVIIYWGVFIYTGYSITNSFLIWLNKHKPVKNKKDYYILPFLILFDGLIVVAIDLFMDPLQVREKSWIWLDGGPYFGIPIGNFIGWVMVVLITTGIFRTYEYFKPIVVDKSLNSSYLLPVLGYSLLYIHFFTTAINLKMNSLAFIGSITMLPIILINLIIYKKSMYSKQLF